MRRPAAGDRWQHRKTSRVCTVEALEGGPDAATSVVVYRYETRGASLDRAPSRQRTSLAYFNVAFSEYERAAQ